MRLAFLTIFRNFTAAEMRSWYTSGSLHFVSDGMDFWWNDEVSAHVHDHFVSQS